MATINKALNETNIKNIVENFNKDFETNLKADNTRFLVNLYNNFITLLETDSTLNNNIFEKLDTLEKEIDKTYSEEEKLLFAKWTNTYERLISDVADQAFVYGYFDYYLAQEALEKINKLLKEPIGMPAVCKADELMAYVQTTKFSKDKKFELFINTYAGPEDSSFWQELEANFSKTAIEKYKEKNKPEAKNDENESDSEKTKVKNEIKTGLENLRGKIPGLLEIKVNVEKRLVRLQKGKNNKS